MVPGTPVVVAERVGASYDNPEISMSAAWGAADKASAVGTNGSDVPAPALLSRVAPDCTLMLEAATMVMSSRLSAAPPPMLTVLADTASV